MLCSFWCGDIPNLKDGESVNKHSGQKNIPWLGALVESLYTSLPILSIINFLSIITVLYTSVSPYLAQYAPWVKFWIFILALVIFTLTMMALIWKFIVPSLWTYRSKQMFEHESEISNKLDKVIRRLYELDATNKK